MNDYLVIDDILPKKTQDYIENRVLNPETTWNFLNAVTVNDDYDRRVNYTHSDYKFMDTSGLCNAFYYDDRIFEQSKVWLYENALFIINEFVEKTGIDYRYISRMKVNMLTKSTHKDHDENCTNIPHVDTNGPHWTLLYYINDSDGDTFLYDQKYDEAHNGTTLPLTVKARVSPKKGRLLAFNGLLYHSSSNPINYETRLNMNINIIL